jgi:hypothetical protein
MVSLSSLAMADCKEPETGTKKIGISLSFSEVVIGAGRLQFIPRLVSNAS